MRICKCPEELKRNNRSKYDRRFLEFMLMIDDIALL